MHYPRVHARKYKFAGTKNNPTNPLALKHAALDK